MTYEHRHRVSPIDSPYTIAPRRWYEVAPETLTRRNEFHLWVVEHDPRNDSMTCSCERRACGHMRAVLWYVVERDEALDYADRLAFSRGQY